MNALTITNEATMTSREIADLVEKRHDNVKRTIETLVDRGAISQPQIEDGPKSGNGVVERHYLIGKRDSYVIVAQLSPEFTARLVDRWQELEARAADPMVALRDPATLRGLLLGYTEEIVALKDKVSEQAPKVEALDRIATASEGSFSLREAAKVMQMQEKQFIQYLHGRSWIYRHPMGSRWLAHSPQLRAGYMEHKMAEGERQDGTRWESHQARVTAKGMARIAVMLGVDLNQQAA